MRTVRVITLLSLLGAIATAILFFVGNARAGSVALVLIGITLTSGFTAASGPLGAWGVPGDEH